MSNTANVIAIICFASILSITVRDLMRRIRQNKADRRNTAYTITFHDYNRLKIKTNRLDMVATLVYFMSMDALYYCLEYVTDADGEIYQTHEWSLETRGEINFYHIPSQRLVCTISKNN